MSDGARIAALVMRGVVSICMYFINSVTRAVNQLRFRAQIRQIHQNNEENRKVQTVQEPQKVSELLAGVSCGGKTLTTGDDVHDASPWRNVITTHVVKRARAGGMGAIVLHNGDDDLVARLQAAFGTDVMAMDERDPRLDLTCNQTMDDIVRFLMDEENAERYRLPESSFQYLETLLEMYRQAIGRMPCYQTLVDMSAWNREKVSTALDRWVRDGYLTTEEALGYQEQLDEFVDGRHKLNRYLDMIRSNLGNVLAPASLPYRNRITVRSALVRGKVLTIDLRRVHEFKPVLGMIGMLIEEAFSKCSAGLLVMDNISFGESPRMKRLMIERPVNLSVHLSMNDVVARCGSNGELLNTLMSGSQCCFVLNHQNGHSCDTLSRRFGTYEHVEVEMTNHLGGHKGHADIFGGSDSGTGFCTRREFRPRVQSGQIEQLPEGGIFMTKAGMNVIMHCPMEDA